MKGLKKIALASAVMAASAGAFAMEAMDDATLSDITGQDGITITMDLNVTQDLLIEDTDGASGVANLADWGNDGMIVIRNAHLTANGLRIDVDAGGSSGATNAGILSVRVTAPSIVIGSGTTIGVAEASGLEDGVYLGPVGGSQFITMGSGDITISGVSLAVQLGSEQTDFVTMNGTIGGIVMGADDGVASLSIQDATPATGGAIGIDQVVVGALDLTGITVNVVSGTGLQIKTNGALSSINTELNGVTLGTAQTIGNVYIQNMSLANNTITVSGH